MNRTQIYLDDSQHDRLFALAQSRGTTASAVIREAIDRYLEVSSSPDQKVASLRALASRFDSRSGLSPELGGFDVVESIRESDADRLRSSS